MARILPWLAAAVVLAAPAMARAQTKKEDPKANKAEIRFSDGSTIAAVFLQDSVEITTKYGKLTVPVSEIRRIEFGFRLAEGVGEKIDAAIRRLGDNNFKMREAAVQELIELGAPAYPALLVAEKDPDTEVVKRAQEAMRKIRERVPEEHLKFNPNDRIETRDFPIVGKIAAPVFKVKTKYFGENALQLADLRSLRMVHLAGDATVSLDAAKYGVHNTWMETEVVVESGVALTITADGQVDIWPQGPGQYMTTADGYGLGPGKPAMMVKGGQVHPGQLIGKIGENGAPFRIGTKYEATPSQTGKLYLHIGPSQWGMSSGTYTVRVVVGGK